MSRRVTIADVAKAASVGKVTVSYVLNGHAATVGISKETVRRVEEVAKQLDYRPNAVARMLTKKRSDAIAVVFQNPQFFSVTSGFTNEALHAVCEECVALGLDLMLHTKPNRDAAAEADALSDGRVDGILMLRDADDPTLAALQRRGFPVVQFFSRSEDMRVPYVDGDNCLGGTLAAQHLVSLGHTRIGFVSGPERSVNNRDREKGFFCELEKHDLRVDAHHFCRMGSSSESYDDFLAILDRADCPTAFFVWSDDVAVECMHLIRSRGRRVPDDISLVGFDSTGLCTRVDPPLTSVRQPIDQMARKATQLLAQLIRGTEPVEHIVFPPTFDVRGSTSSLPNHR